MKLSKKSIKELSKVIDRHINRGLGLRKYSLLSMKKLWFRLCCRILFKLILLFSICPSFVHEHDALDISDMIIPAFV